MQADNPPRHDGSQLGYNPCSASLRSDTLKRIALVILSLLILVYLAAIFVPFDPKDRRPGTRLSGDLAEDQNPDWSFIEGRSRAYVETRTLYLIPHSITVSSWSTDGLLYVGCGACDTKYWPKNVARDPLSRDGLLILALIGGVVLTELLAETFRIARHATPMLPGPSRPTRSPVLPTPSLRRRSIGPGAVAFWANVVLISFFLAYLPRSKHLHIVTAVFNTAFRKLTPRGRLPSMGPRGGGGDLRCQDRR